MQIDSNKTGPKYNMPPVNRRMVKVQQPSSPNEQFKHIYTPNVPQMLYKIPGTDSIKSPSPDQAISSMLTPSKVKYLGEDKSRIKGMDRTPHSSEKSFVKIFEQSYETSTTEGIKTYVSQLEHQVNVLTIQNRNLIKRIDSSELHGNRCSLSHVSVNNTNANTDSQTNLSNKQKVADKIYINDENNETKHEYRSEKGGRRNMLIIEKIKEQYRENLSTLKLMIEHEMKENVSVVQEACRVMENQVFELENRLEDVEKIAHMAKIKYILYQHDKNEGLEEHRNCSPSKFSHKTNNLAENTISDILCVSIPEQQWQQSRNSTTVPKLEEQIERLKKDLFETEKHYKQQIRTHEQKHQKELEQVKYLSGQLQQSQKYLKSTASNNSNQINTRTYNSQIKQQLLLLQSSISQLAEQLLQTKQMYNAQLLQIEEKNYQLETRTRDMLIMRDKIIEHEKNYMLVQQKNNYLEASLSIANRELKDRKQMLEDAINNRNILEKQKINFLKSTNIQQGKNSQMSVDNYAILDLTQRIDRLLQLEEQRESSLKVQHKNPFVSMSTMKNQE